MNPFSEDYFSYDEVPLSMDKTTDAEFSLTSPNSDSTGLYVNPLSPSYPNYFQPNDQYGSETFVYERDYDPQTYQSSQRGGGHIVGQFGSQEDEKLLTKSKRIMKRNAAKERKKAKEETTFSLEGIDKKFIPEGFDDPNLDEKTRKKMIQMIRNRISAQNSRDRKKFQMQKLEDINTGIMEENTNLLREKAALLNEIAKMQENERKLYKEIENLRQSTVCSSCGRAQNGDFTHNMDEAQQYSTEEEGLPIGGLSNLSSPLLTRFASGGKGFLAFFAFTCFLSLIVVMNYQQKEVMVLGGLKDTRILDNENGFCQNPDAQPEPVNVNERELWLANSVVIRNMKELMSNFDMNHKLAFKSHVQHLEILETIPETGAAVDLLEPEIQNAIVGPNYFKASNLRKRDPIITAKNLPILSQISPDQIQTSRLFCPSAVEFTNTEEKETKFDENGSGQRFFTHNKDSLINSRALDLEKADYLQLFVPRESIAKYNSNNTLSDLYGLPLKTSDEGESTILEIWCKVFLVRELSSNF